MIFGRDLSLRPTIAEIASLLRAVRQFINMRFGNDRAFVGAPVTAIVYTVTEDDEVIDVDTTAAIVSVVLPDPANTRIPRWVVRSAGAPGILVQYPAGTTIATVLAVPRYFRPVNGTWRVMI
jgi:hypothetical protein